jgi:glucose-6-phosphate isomerase
MSITNKKSIYNYLKKIINTLPHFKCLDLNFEHLKVYADRFKCFEDVIFLGTGGSSLGGAAIMALSNNNLKMHFIDNIDTKVFSQIINSCNRNNTGVVIISKSGNTPETVMQVLTLKTLWPDFNWSNQGVIITENNFNALKEIASKLSIPTLRSRDTIGHCQRLYR